jgi:hypothetical protein
MKNHDHALVCRQISEWNGFLRIIDETELEIAHVSHWPESLGWNFIQKNLSQSKSLDLGFFNSNAIGTVLIARNMLRGPFVSDFTDGKPFVRPDNPFGPWLKFDNGCTPVP